MHSGPQLPQQHVPGLGFEPRPSGPPKCALTAVAAGWLEAWAQEMGRPGFHPDMAYDHVGVTGLLSPWSLLFREVNAGLVRSQGAWGADLRAL